MSYLSSDNVSVFPSTRRSSFQVSARQMSELRIANLINQLIDMEGFIITSPQEFQKDNNKQFEFNIHGYYFKVNDVTKLFSQFSDQKDIYASIRLLEVGNDYVELVGQDDAHTELPDENNTYYGVNFVPSASSGPNIYSLHLFTRDEENEWKIVVNSLYKFDASSLKFSIDGGKI